MIADTLTSGAVREAATGMQTRDGNSRTAAIDAAALQGDTRVTPAARPELAPDQRYYRPLPRQEIARGYQNAFFMLRDLSRTQAHLMTQEGCQIVLDACSYVGWRFNKITLANSDFNPGPWRGSEL